MSTETTALERVFEFEDMSFRSYMTDSRLDPIRLAEHHEAMADSAHPIVQLGAGWAAMELATYRDSAGRPSVDFKERCAALSEASKSWSKVDLAPFIEAQPSVKRELDATVLGLRMKLAIGSLPAANVVAHWLADEPLDFPTVQHNMQQARLNTAEAARAVKSMRTRVEWAHHDRAEIQRERSSRSGLATNYAFSLAVNSDQLHRYVSLPASLRRENHQNERSRVSALAVNAEQPHRRTRVDIKTETPRRPAGGYTLQIVGDTHLVTTPQHRAHDTLEALIDQETGKTSEYQQLTLDIMIERLVQKIDRFQSTFAPKTRS